jgi:hypothetical protein
MATLLKLTSLDEARELQVNVKHPVKQASPYADEKKPAAPPKGFETVKVKLQK